jgi:hypothetical protein
MCIYAVKDVSASRCVDRVDRERGLVGQVILTFARDEPRTVRAVRKHDGVTALSPQGMRDGVRVGLSGQTLADCEGEDQMVDER